MNRNRVGGVAVAVVLLAGSPSAWAQKPAKPVGPLMVDQPNAQHTRDEFHRLLDQYPPTVRQVLAIDPQLLGNEGYLAQYPALSAFVGTHPEIVRNGSYYAGEPPQYGRRQNNSSRDILHDVMNTVGIVGVLSLGIALLTWLIRTLVDYRRWNRLTKIQTDVHTRLMERFQSNEELMAYIHSPAGAKFLESSPISLDAGPRQVSAPVGRILWSLQAGLVLLAAGIGLISIRVDSEIASFVDAAGMLVASLGAGFVVSAGVSYMISRRLGLITPVAAEARATPANGGE
jgi:hypothetical protein